MSKIRTHYDNLKIASNAPDSLIRAAYKVLLQQHHPDKAEGAKQQDALRITHLIRESYDVLSDPIKRAEHDRWIKEQESEKGEFKYNEKQSYQKQENNDAPQVPIENNSGCFWIIGLVIFCFWIFSDDDKSSTTEATEATEATEVRQEQFVAPPLSKSYEAVQEKIVVPPLPKNDIELLNSAKELLKQKQFEPALTIYRNLADSDNLAVQAEAQNELGVRYSEGAGVTQSYSIAMLWFQKSANQKYAGAEYNLGWLYEKGLGVQKDYAMAVFWYQKATDHGYSTEHSKNALIDLGDDLNSLRTKFSNELRNDNHTKIWFEQSFKNGSDDFHVIFTKTSENGLFDDCHACGVEISSVTYKKVSDSWKLVSKQAIGKVGSNGDAPTIKQADILKLSENKLLFLIDDSYTAQGVVESWQYLFIFSQNTWSNIGGLSVGYDSANYFGHDSAETTKYEGKISVVSSKKEYPDLLVVKKGTERDYEKDIIFAAKNSLYVFNGKEYEEKQGAQVQTVKNEKVAIVQDTLAAKSSVMQMLDYAVDNGGVGHESEIQEAKLKIEASPKPAKGNKKAARKINDEGHALLNKQDIDGAVAKFSEANRLDASDVEVVNNLGFAYLKQKNLELAQQMLIDTLMLAPARAAAWSNLGDVFALSGDERKAVACYANTYRFSKDMAKTHQFMKKMNAAEDVPALKQARDSAMSWAQKVYPEFE